ncbi:MAG: polysaccharide pyruvyl transferase family protein [Hyphomicrobiales bacterium]
MKQINSLVRSEAAARASESPFELTVFDTAIGSQNLGDQIIMKAAYGELRRLFPQAHLWSLPTHDHFGPAGRKRLRHSLFSIACGTNLIHQEMPKRGHWRLPKRFPIPVGYYHPKRLALMAVGSNAEDLSSSAASFLKKSLWSAVPVSSRDKKTADILSKGNLSAAHTTCVTMWDLPKDHAEQLPKHKAEAAVVCLTGTRKAPHERVAFDIQLLEKVRSSYKKCYYWPQGQVDMEYFLSLDQSGFEVLPHSLEAYENLLTSQPSLDYIGARLHGGILAMMHGCRPLIVKVDNRAADIGDSVNLPVIGIEDLDSIDTMINQPRETRVSVPYDAIEMWRSNLINAVEDLLPTSINLSKFRGR